VWGPSPYVSAYGAAKTGLMRFTEQLAQELKDYNVRVFGLFPGAVRSGITQNMRNSPEGKKWIPKFAEEFKDWEVPSLRAAELTLELLSGKFDALSGRHVNVSHDRAKLAASLEKVLADDLVSLRVREFQQS